MSNELKPCPFCGEEAITKIVKEHYPKTERTKSVSVMCSRCGVEVFATQHEDINGAIKTWNRRTP